MFSSLSLSSSLVSVLFPSFSFLLLLLPSLLFCLVASTASPSSSYLSLSFSSFLILLFFTSYVEWSTFVCHLSRPAVGLPAARLSPIYSVLCLSAVALDPSGSIRRHLRLLDAGCLAMCRPFSFVGCISIVAICRLPVCLSGYFRRLAVVIFPPVVECLPCPPVSHLSVAVYVHLSNRLFDYHYRHRCHRRPVGRGVCQQTVYAWSASRVILPILQHTSLHSGTPRRSKASVGSFSSSDHHHRH